MNETYDFGLILQNLRKERHMSQSQLASLIHKESSIISRYENNLQNPTFETVCAFARIFNVSIDYLAGIERDADLSTDGLSERQRRILHDLADLFRRDSHEMMTLQLEKYNLLVLLMEEFTSARKPIST